MLLLSVILLRDSVSRDAIVTIFLTCTTFLNVDRWSQKGRPVPPGFWRRHSKGRLSWSDDYQGGCLAEYYEVGTAIKLGLTFVLREGEGRRAFFSCFLSAYTYSLEGSRWLEIVS